MNRPSSSTVEAEEESEISERIIKPQLKNRKVILIVIVVKP